MYPSLQRHFYLGKYKNNELTLKAKTQFMSSIIAIHSKSPLSIMVFFHEDIIDITSYTF